MGTDKALLGPADRPLAARVAGALRAAGVAEVLMVGGDGPSLRPHGDDWVADDLPGQGPLAAIATAVARRPGRPLLVCACDLPAVTGADLRPLADAVREGAPAAVFDVAGRAQWSAVALSAAVGTVLRQSAAGGERALHRALPEGVAHLAPDPPGPPRRCRPPGGPAA